MNLLKKLFVYSVVITTVLWSVGASFAPLANAAGSYPAGSLLAVKGQTGAAVYLIGTDMKKYVFPSQKEYSTWYPNFDKVVRVSVAELDMYPSGGAVTVRPGTKLVTHMDTARVYAIEPGGIARWIPTDTIAKALYGNNWTSRLVDVIPGFFTSYKTVGTTDVSDKFVTGTVVKMGTTMYYIDGNTKRVFADNAAYTANGYMASDAVEVSSLTGYTDGSSITGAEAAIKDFMPNADAPVVVSGPLSVSLAASSPASGTIITDSTSPSRGQALANLGVFNFTAGSDGAAVVKTIKFTRAGVSSDTDLDTLYLFDGNTRVADGGSISAGVVTFNNSNGLFTVPAGTTKAITLKADVAVTSAGKTISFGINSASDVVTSGGAVTGSFPARANVMTTAVVNDLGSLKVATGTPSGVDVSIDPNQSEVEVATLTLTAENQKLHLERLVLTEIGSIQVGDLINFKLLASGNQIATAEMANDYTVTFDMAGAPLEILSGNSKVLSVRADIIKGSTRTFYFSVQYRSDIVARDTNYGVYVWPRDQYVTNGSWSTIKPTGNYKISQGAVNVNKSSDSPNTSVSLSASNVTLAKFDMKATGEDMRIKDLNVRVDGATLGLDNGKVFVDGVQVGSTKDLTDADSNGIGDIVNFTFGSSFIIPAGTTKVVSIIADTKTSTGQTYATAPSAMTVYLTTGSSNGQGLSSLQTANIPSSVTGVASNQLSTSASSMAVTKFSGYGDQTLVAGSNNAKVGSFVINTGSTAGVNLTSITVNLSNDEQATITNLLIKRNDTGAQFGTTKGDPTTSNVFNGTVNIPAASLMVFDLYADINTGADAGPWTASIDASGTSSVDGNTVSDSGDVLQTMTLGSGSLTLSTGTQPDAANLIAGTSGNHIGQFRFNAANTAYTINKLNLNFPNNFSTSTASVTIEYPKADGTTGSMTSVILSGTASTLYAAFAGVGMYVAKDSEALLNVKVSLATIASGANSGAVGAVTMDPGTNFEAVNTAGSVLTSVGSTEYTGNNFYVRKSVPTFTRVAISDTTPASDSPLFKFTVTADTAGTIDIKQLGFTVTTSGVTVTALKLHNSSNGTALTDAGVDPAASGFTKLIVGAVDNDVLSIGTSASTYDIRGTVTGWGQSGDELSIKFREDTSAITPVAGFYSDSSETLRASHYNIWSDRSASAHSTVTSDWTNGYLLKNMTGTQTYSKS